MSVAIPIYLNAGKGLPLSQGFMREREGAASLNYDQPPDHDQKFIPVDGRQTRLKEKQCPLVDRVDSSFRRNRPSLSVLGRSLLMPLTVSRVWTFVCP